MNKRITVVVVMIAGAMISGCSDQSDSTTTIPVKIATLDESLDTSSRWRYLPDSAECPKCRTLSGVKIAYGLPDEDALERADKGEIALGGCCVTGSDPDYECKGCSLQWRVVIKDNFDIEIPTTNSTVPSEGAASNGQ